MVGLSGQIGHAINLDAAGDMRAEVSQQRQMVVGDAASGSRIPPFG